MKNNLPLQLSARTDGTLVLVPFPITPPKPLAHVLHTMSCRCDLGGGFASSRKEIPINDSSMEEASSDSTNTRFRLPVRPWNTQPQRSAMQLFICSPPSLHRSRAGRSARERGTHVPRERETRRRTRACLRGAEAAPSSPSLRPHRAASTTRKPTHPLWNDRRVRHTRSRNEPLAERRPFQTSTQ